MSKTGKNKGGKVPKITEAEYAAYVNRLREMSDREEGVRVEGQLPPKEGKPSLS